LTTTKPPSTPLCLPLVQMTLNHEQPLLLFHTPVPSISETSTKPMEPPSDQVYMPVVPPLALGPPPPLDLVQVIKDILAMPLPCPQATKFAFQLNKQSAAHNTNILALYQYDLDAAILAEKNSPLQYGYEFRPPSILAPLITHHPNWHKINSILDRGLLSTQLH
jgi:hypothetical protein